MRKCLLLLCLFHVSFINWGQNTEVTYQTNLPQSQTYFSKALVNEDQSLLLVDISLTSEAVRKSNYFLFDLRTFKLKSKFKMNRWSYLLDAYFIEEEKLYISFGIRLRSKYMIYDTETGQRIGKIIAKKSPRGSDYSSGSNKISSTTYKAADETIFLKRCTVKFIPRTGEFKFNKH